MTFIKTVVAFTLAVAFSMGARADDGDCKPCKEKKPKCAACEEPKRCGNAIKNFFVHRVGGTIDSGLKQVPCRVEGAYTASANADDCHDQDGLRLREVTPEQIHALNARK